MLLRRYKFESNSQLAAAGIFSSIGCLCYYVDTSLKAIHNAMREIKFRGKMFMLLRRYKFESNSQLHKTIQMDTERCLCYYVDTSLKAIHNVIDDHVTCYLDVYAIT